MSAVTMASEANWAVPSARFRRRLAFDRWIGRLLPLVFLAVLFPIFDMVYWIGSKAVPTLSWTILTTNPSGFGGGLYASILGTFYLLLIATGIAAAVGLVAGMYTAEFALPKVASAARMAGNLLAGTPAMVVGYFGYFALVIATHTAGSVLFGGITLSIFILPYIYRTSDLAFASVPSEQREAALGIGSTRLQYLLRVGLPIAFPRILTGVFVAMAIGLGETAPLLFTAGWNFFPPQTLNSQTSYLTGVIWNDFDAPSTLGTLQTLAFQAAFLLIMIVIVLNIAVQLVAELYRRRLRGLYR